MQVTAPAIFDLTQETSETQSLYGLDQKETAEYGRICLLTRRLVERGVRFIQIRSGGWDSHSDIETEHGKKCRAIDKPLAALLIDLKRRGLLDQTLIICGGEFGRTPASQWEPPSPAEIIHPPVTQHGSPAAAFAADRSSERPMKWDTRRSSVRSIRTICTRRFCMHSVSTNMNSFTNITTAASWSQSMAGTWSPKFLDEVLATTFVS